MKRGTIIGLLVFTVLAVIVSILFLKPAKPIIDIKGEPLVVIQDNSGEIFDVVITNTLFTAWVVMAVVLLFWFFATRRMTPDVPSGLQNLGESIIEVIDSFVTGIAGAVNGRRFFPLIATLFIYIAIANWLSLTPIFNTIGIFEPLHAEEAEFHERAVVFKDGGVSLILPGAEDISIEAAECEELTGHDAEVCREEAIEAATHEKVDSGEKVGILAPYLRGINTDLMTPAAFAIVAVFFVEYWGVSTLGFFRYMGRFVNFRSPIDFFVGFLETVAEIARLISFSFRLFGNMLAGEILLLVMTFLVPLASTFLLVFYGLELFVGAIQAFVFGALTLVFGVLAVSHHGPEEHGSEDSHH